MTVPHAGTCAKCIHWCATDENELSERHERLNAGDRIVSCPRCGSYEWAITRDIIACLKLADQHMAERRANGVAARLMKWFTTA